MNARPASAAVKQNSVISRKGSYVKNSSRISMATQKPRPQSAIERIKSFRRQNYLHTLPRNPKKAAQSWKHKKKVNFNDSHRQDVSWCFMHSFSEIWRE